jgi:hypothetical protein
MTGNPEVFAHRMIGALTDHYAEAISLLTANRR